LLQQDFSSRFRPLSLGCTFIDYGSSRLGMQ